MGIGDIRFTVLQIVNEIFIKLGLSTVSSLSGTLASQMVTYINDVCDELSDFGNWMEMFVSANITAVSGQTDYSINTSANVKNIADLFFSTRNGPMNNVTPDQMRIMTRTTATGTPTQFTVFGTDNNGNPLIRVRPTPVSAQSDGLFSITYYIRCPNYTTSDASTVVPFPAKIVINGVLAMQILNESGGAPTDRYTQTYNIYLQSRKEALNRFKGDTGYTVSFTPGQVGRRR